MWLQPLLEKPDVVHQFSVALVGAQGIEQGIDTQLAKGAVVFLIGGVEPFEGMVLVAQIPIQLRDQLHRVCFHYLRGRHYEYADLHGSWRYRLHDSCKQIE